MGGEGAVAQHCFSNIIVTLPSQFGRYSNILQLNVLTKTGGGIYDEKHNGSLVNSRPQMWRPTLALLFFFVPFQEED